MASARPITDHDEIKRWVEEREGWPSHVPATSGGDDPGMLRIDFPGYSGEGRLERISWEEFFDKFDEKGLVFVYQDQMKSGAPSRVWKFVQGE